MVSGGAKKALYVYLCSFLGVLLFLIIHRSLFFFFYFLLDIDYTSFSFGFDTLQVQAFDMATLIISLFLGGWYGVWLGMNWYDLVYGSGHTGWLYASKYWWKGFMPHHDSQALAATQPHDLMKTADGPHGGVPAPFNKNVASSMMPARKMNPTVSSRGMNMDSMPSHRPSKIKIPITSKRIK
jgi:hypothetical protein